MIDINEYKDAMFKSTNYQEALNNILEVVNKYQEHSILENLKIPGYEDIMHCSIIKAGENLEFLINKNLDSESFIVRLYRITEAQSLKPIATMINSNGTIEKYEFN